MRIVRSSVSQIRITLGLGVGVRDEVVPAPEVGGRQIQRDPAVQQLIDLIYLTGAIVTTDAMHCQIETAAKFADK